MSLPDYIIRGAKRRRSDDEECSEKDQEAELHQKLHHALRALHKAVKKARTFEVQKTLKKLKNARRKNSVINVIKDFESQVEALKHLDYDQLAQSALVTKLRKAKTLSTDPLIQAISVKLASNAVSLGAPGTPMAKVQSRILSSKVLASEAVSIVESLKTLLHPSTGSKGARKAAKNSPRSSSTSKEERTQTGTENDAYGSEVNIVNPRGGHESTSGDEAMVEVDDGWESGTVDASLESDDSVAGSSRSGSDDSDDEAHISSVNARRDTSQTHRGKGQSEFLPALSVGFARGDSDSEFSDSKAKWADGIKRNRRGQRARRAIWEKKFGKNANHIKKQRCVPGSVPIDRRSDKGSSLSQPEGRTPRSRAPTSGHGRISRPTLGGTQGTQSLSLTKGKSEHIQRGGYYAREKQGGALLHPSWEAKRKQKTASIMPSQGSKIVFS